MWIGVVTIFPSLITATLQDGVVGRAMQRGDIQLELFNPRDFTDDAHRTVDDRPFGGGPGMVMMAPPLAECVKKARESVGDFGLKTILLSPQGRTFDQETAVELSDEQAILLVAGRYEGIDERFVDQYVDFEISIGDYVLSGGELPALVVLDAVGRLISGTLSNPESTKSESHSGGTLDFPQYTRPRTFEGDEVPEVLLSGNHKEIDDWRRRAAIRRTWNRRPDLLLQHEWDASEKELVRTLEIGPALDTGIEKENES